MKGAAISKSEQGECAARTSACVQTAGEIAVGSWAYKKSWRLMMQRKRASGVGGVTGRSSTTKSSARRAHMAPGLASKVQLRHLRRHQDQAQVFSRYPAAVLVNCRWSRRAQQHDGKQCVKSACSKQCGFQGWRPKCSCGVYGGTRIRPKSSRGIRLLCAGTVELRCGRGSKRLCVLLRALGSGEFMV